MKKILLTGFEPFGKHKNNPSKIIINGKFEYNDASIEFKKVVLSNHFDTLKKEYQKILQEYKPDVIINLGLDSKIQSLKIEKIALNIALDHINGTKTLSILEKKENALINKLDINKLASFLNSKQIPTTTSFHAGIYSCNYIYYLSLNYSLFNNSITIFIHLPYTHKMASESISTQKIIKPSLSKKTMENGITKVIGYLLKQI